jgi:hypothetical protein
MAKPKRPPRRSISLVRPADADGVSIFCLSSRGQQTFYAAKEIPCAIGGRGFALHRLGLGPLYFVRVGEPEECSCECLGFLAHGNCKHIQGLLTLIEHDTL